jgi:hypothetical protein
MRLLKVFVLSLSKLLGSGIFTDISGLIGTLARLVLERRDE